jgi:hypothetical protein
VHPTEELVAVEEMEVGGVVLEQLEVGGVVSLPQVDLLSAATAADPLAQGKRSKTVMTPAATKVIKKKTTLGSVRKSARHATTAAIPAMEKAKKLAAEQNLDTATAGMPDDFTILTSRADAQLGSVITDCCMVFVASEGTPTEAISLLRDKEEAQAALARVAANQAREMEARASREVSEAAAANADVGDAVAHATGPGSEEELGQDSSAAGPQGESGIQSEVANFADVPSRSMSPRKRSKHLLLMVHKGQGKRTVSQ